jgi:hypothetical protein
LGKVATVTENDVLGLLIYANELDGRHAPNEAKVYAWKEVFDSGAPGMDAQFAKDEIRRHYSLTDEMVSPAKIIKAWKVKQRAQREARAAFEGDTYERHCQRGGCRCTHAEPCFKGWMDSDTETSPCPMCRGDLADVLLTVAPLGRRSEHDYAAIRSRTWGEPRG